MSVNDAFVMWNWWEKQEVKNIKYIPDGNGDFTKAMGMLVKKNNLGFGDRSWRYSMLVDNGIIVKIFEDEVTIEIGSDKTKITLEKWGIARVKQ